MVNPRIWVAPSPGYNAPRVPASLLPPALEINQTPIRIDPKRTGASLFTSDKPIGDKQSSPIVCRKYSISSQSILTPPPPEASLTPKAIIRYPRARKKRPSDCFFGEDGSRRFLFKKSHNCDMKGARSKMNSPLTLLNQLGGLSV